MASPRRLVRNVLTLLAVLLLSAIAAISTGGTAAASAKVPAATAKVPAPRSGLPAAIEPQSIDYVAQASCEPAFKPGTAALGRLLSATYPGITVQGSYGCGTDGSISEHYEGRAIDWMTSARVKAQAADANALIGWLLATDKAGDKFAMARRLGIMYIIWNNRIWGGWDGTWQPYNNCAKTPQASSDNACHRTHIHLSLTWNGAMGRTSYWSKKVLATDYGPCRARDLNWAGPYTGYNPQGCADFPAAHPPAKASAKLVQLYQYSGALIRIGSNGPGVTAVQDALGVATTGWFYSDTQAALLAFQRSHRVPATGNVDTATWRALLAAFAPIAPVICSGSPAVLATGGVLVAGTALCSPQGRTLLAMQTDGNLVEYRNHIAVWSSRTAGKARGGRLVVQTDGNLVLYRADRKVAWTTRTSGQGSSARLSVQDDGNVVLYNGRARWWTGIRH